MRVVFKLFNKFSEDVEKCWKELKSYQHTNNNLWKSV